MSEQKDNFCAWVQDDFESNIWGTGCGNYFSLEVGTPSDNNMKYCCFCGEKLKELHCEDD